MPLGANRGLGEGKKHALARHAWAAAEEEKQAKAHVPSCMKGGKKKGSK